MESKFIKQLILRGIIKFINSEKEKPKKNKNEENLVNLTATRFKIKIFAFFSSPILFSSIWNLVETTPNRERKRVQFEFIYSFRLFHFLTANSLLIGPFLCRTHARRMDGPWLMSPLVGKCDMSEIGNPPLLFYCSQLVSKL